MPPAKRNASKRKQAQTSGRPPGSSRGRPVRRALRRLTQWGLRWFGRALAAAALWVGAYTVIGPPGGYYLAREWVRLGSIQREWRDLEEIAPNLARAVVAAEDARFCDHWGLDLTEIQRALTAGAKGKRLRGASTLSQQVAKNVFLWHGRSWLRKGLEIGFTGLVEAIWTKRRILEVYLNTAEFDEGVFGVEAAAKHYFGRPAARLSLDQAARLAAVLPDPKGRNPNRATDFLVRRAAAIADGARTLEGEGGDGCLR